MQRGKPADFLVKFGKGKAGSIFALANLVLCNTAMWLYGGFIRDLVLRDEVHDAMDLDVGLPNTGGDASAAMDSLAQLAVSTGMSFQRTDPRDPRVVRGFFKAVDGSVDIEVQVCCSCFLFATAVMDQWLCLLCAHMHSPCPSVHHPKHTLMAAGTMLA